MLATVERAEGTPLRGSFAIRRGGLVWFECEAFIHSQSHYSDELHSVSERIIHSHITSDDLRTADSD